VLLPLGSFQKVGTRCDKGNRNGDVGRTIKGNQYHRIGNTRDPVFKVVVSCNKGVFECRMIHREMGKGVFREVQLETSQQQIVVDKCSEVEGRNH
jgi:hypothetical protein